MRFSSMIRAVTVLALVATLIVPAYAGGPGFNANAYRGWPEGERKLFVAGAVDGISEGFLMTRAAQQIRRWDECTTGRSVNQMQAIFEKYLSEHPQQWHQRAAALLYASLTDSAHCSKGR